ncbi:hypothetical protein J6590_097842 [Homalodisca vitripennis]|nr:hypothetical protein J6590_097842 [Homalodisca vitripennis]
MDPGLSDGCELRGEFGTVSTTVTLERFSLRCCIVTDDTYSRLLAVFSTLRRLMDPGLPDGCELRGEFGVDLFAFLTWVKIENPLSALYLITGAADQTPPSHERSISKRGRLATPTSRRPTAVPRLDITLYYANVKYTSGHIRPPFAIE